MGCGARGGVHDDEDARSCYEDAVLFPESCGCKDARFFTVGPKCVRRQLAL